MSQQEIPLVPSVQHCGSCGAPVHWAQNLRTAKPSPIDAETSANGNILLFRRQSEGRHKYFRVLSGDELAEARLEGKPLHTSHFVTCPNSEQHRRSR